MPKIALINPTQNFENIYGKLSDERSVLPPLGLCYLASAMRSKGMDVKIIDAPAVNISNKEAARIAAGWGAKYAGITSTTDTIYQAEDIAKAIKSISADIIVIIGGPHVTARPAETLELFRSFDVGAVGEGELVLWDIVKAFEDNKPLSDIKGVVFKNTDGIVSTQRQEFIQDLDSLPYPAWDLLPELPGHYHPTTINCRRLPSASLVTSRGCPGNCAFCDTKVFGSKYRIHSASYVLGMIRHLRGNYGIRDICFYDDVFTVFRKRLVEICDGLKREKKMISWSCQARVNSVDYDMMKMMKDAGCWKISFGIESASNDILKNMNKHIEVDQSKKVLIEAKRAGLEVEGYFILGFFGETKETMDMTKDFIMNSPLDTVILSCFLPYPGSPAYAHVNEYGHFDEDWRNMNAFEKPRFVPKDLKAEDMVKAQNEIYRSFYFRPKMFAKYALKMITNPAYAARMMKSSLNLTKFILTK